MRSTLAAVSLCTCMAASAAQPHTTFAQEPFFRAAAVVVARDSFELHLNGQVRGAYMTSVARESGNFRVKSTFALGGSDMREEHDVVFNAALRPLSHAVKQTAQGLNYVTDVKVAQDRASGTAQNPGPAGIATANIDVAIPDRTIDDEAVPVLLPTLELAEGLAMTFNSLDARRGRILVNEVKVQGRESVTVPAGTFEVWNVTVRYSTSTQPVTMLVTTAEPRRLVLVRQGPLEMRLAKRF